MTMTESKKIEAIRASYAPVEKTRLDDLKALDKKVKRPAQIFGYVFGTVGSLVLGVGMCLAMEVMGSVMPVGIGIGIIGIAMVSANHYLYKKLLKSRKAKYAKEILALSDNLLNEEGGRYV